MRAGPFWVRFAGSTQASTVISLEACTALMILVAAPGEEMMVAASTVSPSGPQVTPPGS